MNYSETLDYLYNAAPAFEKVGAGAYKEGLSNTKALDEHFGHPHRSFRTIHVAGTNGKGSLSHTLAALLQAAGHKVGLYTSPHLVDFNERIRVDGQPIDHQYVIDFVEQEKNFFEPLQPSFFELTTALAFKYFAEQKVDIAIIEVGLGGRLDCTNIITPILSVITNISLDHTGFLGNTLAQIASEKAGIIKPGVPVVIGETTPETRSVFETKASEMGSRIYFAEDCQYVISSGQNGRYGRHYVTNGFGNFDGELGGECQEKNMNTFLNCIMPVARALTKVGMPSIKNGKRLVECIHEAVANVCQMTGLMGRWQKIEEKPLVICDTGHNLAGWQILSKQILNTKKLRDEMFVKKGKSTGILRMVFGMVDDKDFSSVMKLLPQDAVYYFTQASTHRAVKVERLMDVALSIGLEGMCYDSVNEAYMASLEDSREEDFVFVGGSGYVVSDFLAECR